MALEPLNIPLEPEPEFGRLIGAHQVDDALISMLQKWMDTYLHEIARQSGESFNRLTPVRAWRVSSDMENFPEDQHPCVIVVNNGILELPEKTTVVRQTGSAYTARYEYDVGVQVVAKGSKVSAVPRALRLARIYALAIRGIMVQQRDDNDVLGMIDWVDESPGGLDSVADRTTCLVVGKFQMEVHNVTAWATGPIEPNWPPDGDDPPDPNQPMWPQVQTTDVEVEKVPIEEDME